MPGGRPEVRPGDRDVLVVLYDESRPPGMTDVEKAAEVRYADRSQLAAALPGADALFVWDFFSTALRDAWPAADRLRWVHVASAGVDRLLFPELVESPVVVTNSRGVFDRPIAEYVLGLVLAVAKGLPTTLALQRDGVWRHRETQRIDGHTALVVGTGSIGRACAGLLSAAGLRVTGVGRTARNDPELGRVFGPEDLHRLLGDADYVVIAAPLTEDTRGLFDAAAFAAMAPSAWLVNIGRGAIVIESELLAALERHELAGAALDVFAEEPLPADHPFWSRPDVIVSPHMSGDFVGWHQALVDVFTGNLARWQAGEPLTNQVDKAAGYVRG
jgi:phosphoglycerate dehydrogenase-like enzyme